MTDTPCEHLKPIHVSCEQCDVVMEAKVKEELRFCPGVESVPGIHGGAPCVTGTRVPVTAIVGSFLGGDRFALLSRQYETVDVDVEAALRFALLNPEWTRRVLR